MNVLMVVAEFMKEGDVGKRAIGLGILGSAIGGSCYLMRHMAASSNLQPALDGLNDVENAALITDANILVLLERVDKFKHIISIRGLNKAVSQLLILSSFSEDKFDYKFSAYGWQAYTSLEHELRVIHDGLENKGINLDEFDELASNLDERCKSITQNIQMNQMYLHNHNK